MSIKTNWEIQKEQSNYHFDWTRQEPAGHDYIWLGRFVGNWETELNEIKQAAKKKTWSTRGKQYHKDDPNLESELADLEKADMDIDTVIFRKHFEFDGIFKSMLDVLGLENSKQAFHIQYPGEMLNLHIDKHNELGDSNQIARFFVFLEDWKPGHFVQMGTSFMQWRKGDIIWFDWKNMPHATANAGWEPRCLFQAVGTITEKTKNLFISSNKYIKL